MNGWLPHSGCCSASRAPSISDYIDRGLRRARHTALPVVGAECQDEDGRTARFSVLVTNGIITDVGFRTTPCVTLVAYCEVAAERAGGKSVTGAFRGVLPADLARALPSVPPAKRGCARLASRALVAALLLASRDGHT
jgi:NifU-like protein involved in Fe-S cluster formation